MPRIDRGKYLEQPKLPGRLGYEAAGTAMIWRINMEPIGPSCRFTPMGLAGVQANSPRPTTVFHSSGSGFQAASRH